MDVSSKTEREFSGRDLEKSDAELLLLCRRGDETAWDELVNRYQRLIFAIPRRAGLTEEQAADVFQDVFLTLFEKLDEIEQPEKIRSWIVTTAKFKTWGVIRNRKGFNEPGTEQHRQRKFEPQRIASENCLIGMMPTGANA